MGRWQEQLEEKEANGTIAPVERQMLANLRALQRGDKEAVLEGNRNILAGSRGEDVDWPAVAKPGDVPMGAPGGTEGPQDVGDVAPVDVGMDPVAIKSPIPPAPAPPGGAPGARPPGPEAPISGSQAELDAVVQPGEAPPGRTLGNLIKRGPAEGDATKDAGMPMATNWIAAMAPILGALGGAAIGGKKGAALGALGGAKATQSYHEEQKRAEKMDMARDKMKDSKYAKALESAEKILEMNPVAGVRLVGKVFGQMGIKIEMADLEGYAKDVQDRIKRTEIMKRVNTLEDNGDWSQAMRVTIDNFEPLNGRTPTPSDYENLAADFERKAEEHGADMGKIRAETGRALAQKMHYEAQSRQQKGRPKTLGDIRKELVPYAITMYNIRNRKGKTPLSIATDADWSGMQSMATLLASLKEQDEKFTLKDLQDSYDIYLAQNPTALTLAGADAPFTFQQLFGTESDPGGQSSQKQSLLNDLKVLRGKDVVTAEDKKLANTIVKQLKAMGVSKEEMKK